MSKLKQKKPQRILFWIIGLLSLCMVLLIFLSNANTTTVDAVNVENQPFIGDKAAPVEIVEFGDYKCPVCKNFHEQFVPQIQKDFVDTGKAKFYFINYSFINIDSIRSAKFAESIYKELGNEVFWEFHHLLFEKQPADLKYERMDVYTEEFLEKVLGEIVSEEEVKQVVSSFQNNQSDDAWNQDMKLAERLEVSGTPTLYVNGKKFEGNRYEELKKMVDEAERGE